MKIKYYARYVDYFVLFHTDKNYLLACHQHIKNFLYEKLKMTIHPHKFYLQHYARWVKFLGVMIYPWYRVVGKRIISNAFNKLSSDYGLPRSVILCSQWQSLQQWVCKIYQSLMSYDGLALHHDCYRLRKQWRSSYINNLIIY